MTNTDAFDQLPLRQRKFARTKLGLLHAATTALRERPLEEVTVRELCHAVSISEGSFFNYFPKKTDLLLYYIQLWAIEMTWYANACAGAHGGLAAIEEIFALTARQVAENPAPMGEIVAGQARMTTRPAFGEVSLAERLLAFPELAGIEDVRGEGLDELLPPLIDRAIRAGELPRKTDRNAVLVALAAAFLGLPVVLRRASPGTLEKAYHHHLQLLWAGLRVNHPENSL